MMTESGNLSICEDVFGDDWVVSVSNDEKLLIARYYRPSRPTVETTGFAKRKESGIRVNRVLDEYQILLPEIDEEFRVDTASDVRSVLSDTIDDVAEACEQQFLKRLLTSIDGLGKSRAESVLDVCSNADEFIECDTETILEETTVNSNLVECEGWPDEQLIQEHERET
jgi:hypothetical protein